MVLGIWMTAYPGVSSAENKKVEDDVHKAVQNILQKSDDSTGAKKLANEELVIIRAKKAQEIKQLKTQYGTAIETVEKLSEELKEYSKEAGQYQKTLGDKVDDAGNIMYGAAAVLAVLPVPGSRVVAGVVASLAFAAKRIAGWFNDPEGARAVTDSLTGAGSYANTLKQFQENIMEINFDPVKLKEGQSKDSDVAKAEALIAKYNTTVRTLQKTISDLMPGVFRLDQLIEEFISLPLAIEAGQELYKYEVWGKNTDGDPILISRFHFIMDADGTLKSIEGVTRGCVPLPAKLAESRSCIFCPLFKTIFNAAQNMSTKAYSKLADPLANVMLIGFALVVAFMVLKNVSSFTKQDAPKFITELLVNMFKVLLAFYMLKNSAIVYNYIIGPVLKAGFEFGSSLLFAKKDGYLASCGTPDVKNSAMIGVMPTYLYTNLDCFIKAVQAEVAIPQSIGSSLMCVARNAGKENVGPIRNVLWDFGMMFQGLAIWVMGWIIALAFAFYLIDATIQLGIIGALMPFLIACWPFKVTRKYTNTGWGMFMNTFFVYVFMGLVVSVNVELLGQGLTGSKGGFDAIEAALNGNEVQQLKALLDIGFSGFLVLVACCLFAFKLTGQASSLAGTMAGGGGPSIGAGIGGLAYGAATKAVQGTTKKGLGAAKFVSDRTGLTGVVNRGKDAVINGALGMVGLGRRSGAAGNRSARANQKQASQNSLTPPNANPAVTDPNVLPGGNPTTENQIKKMADAGPRQQQPVVPEPQVPNPTQQGGAAGQETTQAQFQQTQTPEQLKQQLENNYNNTANGKAGQQMMQVQAAEVARNQKAENEAKGKMNYHNRRADDYLNKAQKSSDPAQKKNFEDLANAQFAEAVKAEAAYNKAKADTQKSQAELNSIKQENDRYKNQYVQDEMKKRNPAK